MSGWSMDGMVMVVKYGTMHIHHTKLMYIMYIPVPLVWGLLILAQVVQLEHPQVGDENWLERGCGLVT